MANKKYIPKPEDLLKYFEEYKAWAKKNPFKVKDWVGGMGKQVIREKERALTLDGFECYMFKKGVIKDLGDYFENRNNAYSEFSAICSHIKKQIRTDQIEGGLSGMYNPSITQRINGLTEKTDNTNHNTNFDLTLKL